MTAIVQDISYSCVAVAVAMINWLPTSTSLLREKANAGKESDVCDSLSHSHSTGPILLKSGKESSSESPFELSSLYTHASFGFEEAYP